MQQWTVTISSVPTGATDKNDDGRRLQLALYDENGTRLYQGATDPQSDDWSAPVYTKDNSWSRSGVLTITAAEGAKPAVLKIEKLDDAELKSQPDYKGTTDYIDTITITSTGPSKFAIDFVAQKWITSRGKKGCLIAPEYATNVLFAATSLPQDDSPYVRNLRQLELAKLRGDAHTPTAVGASGSGDGFKGLTQEQKEGARNEFDTIYDYQTYNDLGKPNNARSTLGGKDLPYPRRLATHLATEKTASGIEEPPVDPQDKPGKGKRSKLPWLPLDEKFGFTKDTDFENGKITAALPAALTGIKHLSDELLTAPLSLLHSGVKAVVQGDLDQLPVKPGAGIKGALELARKQDFDSFKDVKSHFSNDVQDNPLAPNMSTPQPDGAKVKQGDSLPQGLDDSVRGWLSGLQDRFDDSILGSKRGELLDAKVGLRKLRNLAEDVLEADILDNLKKPRVLVGRPDDVVSKDWEFGRQMLAGFNPSTIAALRKTPEQLGSAIRDEDVAGDIGADGFTLKELVDDAEKGYKPRLYWVDYWGPYAEFFKEPWTDSDRVLHAGRALFYLKQDEKTGEDVALEPIAIELAAHPSEYDDQGAEVKPVVYSRSKLRASNAEEVWEVAKLVFKSLDVGVHQLISHWLRCHAAIEPFLIAMRRQISTAHPVYKLMLPHFRYTMNINAAARSTLVNAGGIVEQTFAPGSYAMRLSSMVYKTWRFESQALPQDLRDRGMVDEKGNPHIKYPYAEDGMAIWRAMEQYFSDYLAHYYGSGPDGDSRVAADEELQAFWKDVTTKAHPDLEDKSHWGVHDPSKISTHAELVNILVTIAWTASAHHAAVNFGQYDFTSYPLNAPSLIRRAMPRSEEDAGWQDLVKTKGSGRDYEQEILSYIQSPLTSLIVAFTNQTLSTHSDDEQTLDEPNTLLTDDAAKALNNQFIADMKQLEKDIISIHQKGQDWTRCEPGAHPGNSATWSTCLIPGSAPGVTMRGVPFSVSI